MNRVEQLEAGPRPIIKHGPYDYSLAVTAARFPYLSPAEAENYFGGLQYSERQEVVDRLLAMCRQAQISLPLLGEVGTTELLARDSEEHTFILRNKGVVSTYENTERALYLAANECIQNERQNHGRKVFSGRHINEIENILAKQIKELKKFDPVIDDTVAKSLLQEAIYRTDHSSINYKASIRDKLGEHEYYRVLSYLDFAPARLHSSLFSGGLAIANKHNEDFCLDFSDTPYLAQSIGGRNCSVATFTMVHNAIVGSSITARSMQRLLSGVNFLSQSRVWSKSTQDLTQLLMTGSFQKAHSTKVKLIPTYGADFSEIITFISDFEAKLSRYEYEVYFMAELGSDSCGSGVRILHNCIVLHSNPEYTIVHDPSSYNGIAYREINTQRFMGLWAQAFMRGMIVIAVH